MRFEAVGNPDGQTWRLTVRVPGKPDMVCPAAPWSLVEQISALETRVYESPGPLASAVGWVGAPVLMLLGNPWFWLACALGGGWHACVS